MVLFLKFHHVPGGHGIRLSEVSARVAVLLGEVGKKGDKSS